MLHTITYLNFNIGLVPSVDDFKRPELDVLLHGRVIKLSTNQTLDIKHSVLRVCRQLILSRVTDETLTIRGESYVGRGDSITLIICYDFYTTVLVHAHARTK